MPNHEPLNPFRSMPEPLPVATAVVDRPIREPHESPKPRLAKLGFFDCFFEAKEFLGNDYWLFWGLIFVGMLVAVIFPLILLGPMYCGLGYCFLAKERGRRPSFEVLFRGFDQFSSTLLPVLLYSLISFFAVPFYFVAFSGGFALLSGIVNLNLIVVVLGICLISVAILGFSLVSTVAGYGALFSAFLVAEYLSLIHISEPTRPY